MDFGRYLKEIRLSKGLTQSELATHLSLSVQELKNLDVVTISRWERGVTKPSVFKSIKVLRALTNDLTPYLMNLKNKSNDNFLKKIARERYKSSEARLMSASYGRVLQEVDQHGFYIIDFWDKEKKDFNEEIIRFLFSIDDNNSELAVLKCLKDENSFSKKVITNDGVDIIGHLVSFTFYKDELKKHFSKPCMVIPFEDSVVYNGVNNFSLCIISRFSLFESVYWALNKMIVEYIASRANIHDVYFYVYDKWSALYMEHLGAKLVSFERVDANGSIKVGKLTYRNGLYKVDAAKLLSQHEVYSLL
ncbi:helix-turn-helix domain-containing protein [Vibrio cholerae]